MSNKNDFTDPFSAGQLVGMLVMLTFIERNRDIPVEFLEQIKTITADNLQVYFEKPSEDIHLIINDLVNEIGNV